MVNSKKLLSLFLAVVMILSTFSVIAFAYTVGPDVDGAVNYKYSVEKVDSTPETEAGSAEWTADNIYAVTVWMKASKGVDILTAPIHYNKAHFAPIMLSDGDCTYPNGAGIDQDSYYSEMGEGTIYAYSLGDYMNNTGMYKANGTAAATKALAKGIGLGNSNSAGINIIAELVSPDHPTYNKWGAGLPADTGVMYVNLNVAQKAKTVYFNTIEGITVSTDWNRMFTVYFETLEGITDADVVGDEFGVFTDNCYTVDANYDGTGSGYYVGLSSYTAERPATNVVENAVVTAAAKPELNVEFEKAQIKFTSANDFAYRVIADLSNFEEIFTSAAGATDSSDNTYITEAGFIYNKGTAVDEAKALDQINNGTVTYPGKQHQKNAYISHSTGDFLMACVVYDIPNADINEKLSVLAYVKYVQDGVEKVALKTVYADTFADLYNRNSANQPTE